MLHRIGNGVFNLNQIQYIGLRNCSSAKKTLYDIFVSLKDSEHFFYIFEDLTLAIADATLDETVEFVNKNKNIE